MKIKSFGCSFLAGNDLCEPDLTWPARISRKLGLEHQNHSRGGCGNSIILHELLCWATPDDICVINWTYTDRFDYKATNNGRYRETYKTLLPANTDDQSRMYYKYLHSQYHDVFRDLTVINTALDFLLAQKIKFLMLYMDHNLWIPCSPSWEFPRPLTVLQMRASPYVCSWHQKNFLEWCRSNNLPICATSNHPLDEAHKAAADYWLESIRYLYETDHHSSIFPTGWPTATIDTFVDA